MSLTEFAEPPDDRTARLVALGPEQGSPVYRLLTDLFDDDAVTVRDGAGGIDAVHSDAVLLEKDDGTGLAVSTLSAVRDELLLVNSDIYVTGARGLSEVETPDVVRELDGIPFTVTGYPESQREKLLLIEISRHVEAMAYRAGEGRLATGFQFLSRLEDERGTGEVYDRLAGETRVDIHVYGVPDASPDVAATVHGVDSRELRRTWFVVYQSAAHPEKAAALLATETAPHTWEGHWTYDPDRVADILDYLGEAYGR